MNKKKLYLIGIAVIVLICIITYFRPLSLSNTMHDFTQVNMILSQLGVRDGAAYIDSVNYKTTTKEENSKLRAIFDNFTYRRNLGTLFSDGSMSGLGNETLHLYVYDGDTLEAAFFVASTGKVLVNDKIYSMENTGEFIEQIVEVVK